MPFAWIDLILFDQRCAEATNPDPAGGARTQAYYNTYYDTYYKTDYVLIDILSAADPDPTGGARTQTSPLNIIVPIIKPIILLLIFYRPLGPRVAPGPRQPYIYTHIAAIYIPI